MESIKSNNHVNLIGTAADVCSFSHEVYGEGFYTFPLKVKRLSDNFDTIPVTVSDRLLDVETITEGVTLYISGQLRSYNHYSSKKNKLVLTVFARTISFDETDDYSSNEIFLNGFICKKPVYRTTPFGREITDMLIAVNRNYGKSDYIPCIAWGRNAKFAGNLEVGDNIELWGRIQSRAYIKRDENGEAEERTAYEVSLSKIEKIEKQ